MWCNTYIHAGKPPFMCNKSKIYVKKKVHNSRDEFRGLMHFRLVRYCWDISPVLYFCHCFVPWSPLSWKALFSPDAYQTHRDPLASASQVLGYQVCSTMLGFNFLVLTFIFCKHRNCQLWNKKRAVGTLEMAKWLRVLNALSEDPSSLPRIYIVAHNHL